MNLYDVNAGAAAAPVQVDAKLYAFFALVQGHCLPGHRRCHEHCRGRGAAAVARCPRERLPAPPDADAIAAALAHMDIENLVLDDATQTVYFADPAMTLDVGAVGRGYAVEQTAQAAQARGLTSALLNIGGNVRAIGTKPGKQAWTAGVENPWGDDPAYLQAVELADGDSLVISGDYQRYFEYNGVRYAHLIDLTTGWPARYTSSVAVLAHADTGGLADAPLHRAVLPAGADRAGTGCAESLCRPLDAPRPDHHPKPGLAAITQSPDYTEITILNKKTHHAKHDLHDVSKYAYIGYAALWRQGAANNGRRLATLPERG